MARKTQRQILIDRAQDYISRQKQEEVPKDFLERFSHIINRLGDFAVHGGTLAECEELQQRMDSLHHDYPALMPEPWEVNVKEALEEWEYHNEYEEID